MKIRMTTPITKQDASNAIVTGLTGLAFVSSYLHGVAYAKANHAGGWAWAYAAIPEALLASALLQDRKDVRFWVKVTAAFSWTIGVNVAGAVAVPGSLNAGTLIVALLAPAAAIVTAWSGHAKPEPVKPVRKASRKPGVVEAGVKWASTQKAVRSVDEIMAARKCSRRSAEAIQQQGWPMAAVQHKLG